MLSRSQKITDYAVGDGPVRYMDGSTLVRQFDLPGRFRPIVILLLVLAVAIGGAILFNTIGGIVSSTARAQASVEENLARDVALDLPALASLADMDLGSVEGSLADAGHTIYNLTAAENAEEEIDLIKLPSDMSIAEGALMYGKGISNLSASEAALALKGAWRLQIDYSNGVNVSVKYADFDSGSLNAAIDAAIASQGFDESLFSAVSTDSAGNTFREGEVAAGDVTTCRVSAIELSSVYDIDGLPDSAIYVGIRLS